MSSELARADVDPVKSHTESTLERSEIVTHRNPDSKVIPESHVLAPLEVARRKAKDQLKERLWAGPEWIVESRYWNPTGVQLSSESLDELRKILSTAGRELEEILVRKHAPAVQLLKEGIKNGTAKLVPHDTPVPSSTADTRFLMETGTVEGAYLLEIQRSDHPEVFAVSDAMNQAYES